MPLTKIRTAAPRECDHGARSRRTPHRRYPHRSPPRTGRGAGLAAGRLHLAARAPLTASARGELLKHSQGLVPDPVDITAGVDGVNQLLQR